MPVPKLEAKGDNALGVLGGEGLSLAIEHDGESLSLAIALACKLFHSFSSHATPPGISLDSGSGGTRPVDKSVHGVAVISKAGIFNPIPSSAPPEAIREFQVFKGFDQSSSGGGCGSST